MSTCRRQILAQVSLLTRSQINQDWCYMHVWWHNTLPSSPNIFPHTQAYINNLNVAMEKLADAEAKCDVTSIVQLQGAIKFNGGGHLNHSIFWKVQYKQ